MRKKKAMWAANPRQIGGLRLALAAFAAFCSNRFRTTAGVGKIVLCGAARP
jgi:hypothetical protein